MVNSSNQINAGAVLDILTEPVRSLKPDINLTDDVITDTADLELTDFTARIDLNESISIVLSVDKLSADLIAPVIFGFGIEEDDREMYDEFAKEFLNIISGNCKTKLSAEGVHFGFSIPETIGDEIEFGKENRKTILKRSFDYEGGKLILIVIKFNTHDKEK